MSDQTKQQLTPLHYVQAAESLKVLVGMILLDFAGHADEVRDHIARNFIARASTMLGGIVRLWDIKDYGDCWILYRSLLDRLFHLHTLAKENQFEAYDDWSFKMQYEAANRVRSDVGMKGRLAGLSRNLRRNKRRGIRGSSPTRQRGGVRRPKTLRGRWG